jgi:hypothetical protein
VLVSIGDIVVQDQTFGQRFRQQFASRGEGTPIDLRVKRGEQELTLQAKVRMVSRVETRIDADPAASAKAARIRSGILRGTRG